MLRRGVTCLCRCSRGLYSLNITTQTSQLFSTDYRSQYSIDKIYPNSNVEYLSTERTSKSSPYSPDGKELFSGFIPIESLNIKYVRGSGPGGQNVNKVNTKVEVRFHVKSAEWIPDWIREKVILQQPNRINKDGYLIVTSDTTRKQLLNQADCMEKIRAIIFRASRVTPPPTEEQLELKAQRLEARKKKVLKEKKEHALKKQNRQSPII